MNELYTKFLNYADKSVDEYIIHQINNINRLDFGGFFSEDDGYATPGHTKTASLVAILCCCYFSELSKYYNDSEFEERILNALHFIKTQIRESGFIDLPCNNYDSPPDTAFMINELSYAAYFAKKSKLSSAKKIYDEIIDIILPCSMSVSKGGFHTPNHRWVVVAALAQVMELEPTRIDFSEIIEKYLLEGIDINEDGLYFERSIGVYDAVVNIRLLLLAEILNSKIYSSEDFIDMVRKNSVNRLKFMNYDFTVDTSISTRQDYGKKIYIENVASFMYLAMLDSDAEMLCAAMTSIKYPINEIASQLVPAIFFLERHAEWKTKEFEMSKITEKNEVFLKKSGIYRVKDGKFSSTVRTDSSDFMNIRYGNVQLVSSRILLSYFGGAKYIADRIEKDNESVKLHFVSLHNVKEHPAYWMPIGKTVSYEELPFNNVGIRELKKRPDFEAVVEISNMKENGFDISVKTEGGMDAVRFSWEFLFVPNGKVETDCVELTAVKDETLFLKEGTLTYSFNNDFIRIDGGFYSHRALSMNEGTNGMFRVVLTDFSPVERKIHIEYGEINEDDKPCHSEKVLRK